MNSTNDPQPSSDSNGIHSSSPRIPPPIPPSPGAFPPPPQPWPTMPQQPPRKSHRGLWTCLVIILCIGIVSVILLVVTLRSLSSTLSGTWGETSFSLPKIDSKNTVALLRINGLLYEENESRFLEVIKHYRDDKNIRAVLMRVDSPGGTVGTAQEVYNAVLDLKAAGKTVVASFGSVAASGGYYVGCAADRIYSNPGSLTGSIGVIMSLPNFRSISEKVGIGYTTIKGGKFKDVPSTMRDLTDEERNYLQVTINDTHRQFKDAILANRREALTGAMNRLRATTDTLQLATLGPDVIPPPQATVEQYLDLITDGRVLTGRQALHLGLVDAIGSQKQALDALAEMTGIKEPEIYEYRPQRTLLEILQANTRSALSDLGVVLKTGRLEYRMAF